MDKPQSDQQPGQDAAIASATSPRARAVAIALLLVGAVAAGMGQTIVFSVLPPLAREIGLSDIQVGLIFMISAIFWVSAGPFWGRRSDASGRKPFILLGLIGFTISTILFGATVELGLAGALSGAPLYVLLVLTRSLYGAFGSAGPPSAQAYIADRTSATERTAGIAGFSAAFGFGAMLGPGFGAATTFLGKTAPFFAISALAAVMAVAVFAFLPERSNPVRRDKQVKLKFTDERLRPFLMFGLVFGIINAIPIQTIGFYFIDVLGYTTEQAPRYVSIGLTTGAMASLFAQLFVVRRLGLEPRTLMRIAPPMMVVGHALIWGPTLLLTGSAGLWPVVLGMTLSGFGAGLAMPGFNAAASLAVTAGEQGGAIGLANSAGASGFIISPLLGFGLYAFAEPAPYIFTMVLAGALWVYAMRSRSIGNARADHMVQKEISKPTSAPYQ